MNYLSFRIAPLSDTEHKIVVIVFENLDEKYKHISIKLFLINELIAESN